MKKIMDNNHSIDLSICIVNWNTCDKLRECLRSIKKYSEDLNIEIIVVDNASSDNTPTIVKSEFPEVILIQNEKNIGFAKANNQAIKRCRGGYILLLNPDIVVEQPIFKRMITILEKEQTAGVVGCKLVNPDGSQQNSFYKTFPTLLSEFVQGMMFDKLIFSRLRHQEKKAIDAPIEVAWIIGACMLFRRNVLLDISGFDERFFIYAEDMDLCYRLHHNGYKVYYIENLQMLHYHGASSKKQKRKYFAAVMQRECIYKFMRKHHGLISAIMYRIICVFYGLFRTMLLSLMLILLFLVIKNNKDIILNPLEKYLRIVSWGFGFERWVIKEEPT